MSRVKWRVARLEVEYEGSSLYVESVLRGDGTEHWAIRQQNGYCLSVDGKLEEEPRPSERTPEWIKQHRFPTKLRAIHVAARYLQCYKTAQEWLAMRKRRGDP